MQNQIDTASSVPNPIKKIEVEMEETSEDIEPKQALDTERGIKDLSMSDSSRMKSTETEVAETLTEKPSRAGGRDLFAGGESAW